MIEVKLTEKAIDPLACINWVMSDNSGGIDVFIGSVRSETNHRKVMRLEFEAYGEMALNKMNGIAKDVFDKWPVNKILIHHRIGILQIGEIPVLIAVAAAHRAAAFDACRYAIDTLKQNVPIWKKEVYEDGEIWVAAHP
ncbi:MAG: molybdenum cofactor biosynthesis protein MoaE [Bacteroidetes bacterium]|nr:MAG: molybdenum cofactor biosynthesis protein MoaE [Bacteroidota bacterium]